MQNTEPKPIQDVIVDVLENTKQRYYAAEAEREKAAASPRVMHKLDFEVGDVVQIRPNGKDKYIGRLGVIIGIRYKEFEKVGPALTYTIKFSDKEAADFVSDHLNYIRSADHSEF